MLCLPAALFDRCFLAQRTQTEAEGSRFRTVEAKGFRDAEGPLRGKGFSKRGVKPGRNIP